MAKPAFRPTRQYVVYHWGDNNGTCALFVQVDAQYVLRYSITSYDGPWLLAEDSYFVEWDYPEWHMPEDCPNKETHA